MDDTRDEVGEILAGMTGGRTGTAGGVSSPVPAGACCSVAAVAAR